MRLRITAFSMALLFCVGQGVTAQQATTGTPGIEQRVSLEETALAFDGQGRTALAGQLLTKALAGLPDAPVRNARFIIENRSAFLYTYVTGSVTFYDERGVRCGEGLFTMSALAPGEQAETDAPGLRISCAPRSWRMIAHNLLVRSPDKSETSQQAEKPAESTIATTPAMIPLQLVVDDKVYSAPLGSTLEIPVRRRRIRISVRPAQ